MGMASATQNDLWKSVEETNFGQYYRISESMGITHGRQEKPRQSLPIRMFIRNGKGGGAMSFSRATTFYPCNKAGQYSLKDVQHLEFWALALKPLEISILTS